MILGKKVIVILPAYNAEKTLEKTVRSVQDGIVDEFVLVDDLSTDNTVTLATQLGLTVIRHNQNLGYGGNQKTCYNKALELKADIVIMLHPDYQYEPRLVPAMAYMIGSGIYDVVLASRILTGGSLDGGMPLYKYISNRALTFVQNILMGMKMSEFHTGYRAFSQKALNNIEFEQNSDDFVFDNQIIAQLKFANMRFGEISCPTKYFAEASSINLRRSIKYGLGVLLTSLQYRLQKWKIFKFNFLTPRTSGR